MSQTAAELDESIEAVTVDCYGDDEELGAFLQAFEDELELPMSASVVGVPVEVVAMEYSRRCASGHHRPLPSGG